MSAQTTNPQTCLRTPTEISALIKELRNRVAIKYSGPHKSEELDTLEQQFSLHLPEDYRQFLANYGLLTSPGLTILGIDDERFEGLSLEAALFAFRLSEIDIPWELCPIEFLGDKTFACLVCALDKKTKYAPVVAFNMQAHRPLAELKPLANCFRDYLYDRLTSLKPVAEQLDEADELDKPNEPSDKAWDNFEKHVLAYHEKFEYDHAQGGKLPRNHDWRPYRFCIQDVLFGATVVRHWREYNCLQVDVFLTAHLPEYEPLAGARALATFLLSEAYKCGGTMEIRFTAEVEGGRVPVELHQLAAQYQLALGQTQPDRISAGEAKAFYAALSNFSPTLQTRLLDLEKEKRLRVARACYVVHHGVWTHSQVEMIALGSERPDSILGGL